MKSNLKIQNKSKAEEKAQLAFMDDNELNGYSSKEKAFASPLQDNMSDATSNNFNCLNGPTPSAITPVNNVVLGQVGEIQNQNVKIVQNQVDPKNENLFPTFKSTAIRMVCPFCQAKIRTFVETNLNCLNLCCYCWTTCLVWTCFQLIRGKDLSCSDARHSCPKCGRTLGHYEAC